MEKVKNNIYINRKYLRRSMCKYIIRGCSQISSLTNKKEGLNIQENAYEVVPRKVKKIYI